MRCSQVAGRGCRDADCMYEPVPGRRLQNEPGSGIPYRSGKTMFGPSTVGGLPGAWSRADHTA
jgi:hypothetical protein